MNSSRLCVKKKKMTSKIIIEDLKIYAYHGALPEETLIGTYYLLNVEIHADLWKAVGTDDLSDTINYAEINEIIHTEMKVPSKLMEHVAGRILKNIKMKFTQVAFVKIRITKTSPPMTGEMRGVSVEIEN